MMKFDLYWRVTHEDETTQTENQCKYENLNRETIVMISLCKKDGTVLASIACSKNEPFFYRRRVRQRGDKILVVLWIIGRPSLIVGIFDSGEKHYRDRFDESDEWFYPIKFRDDESRFSEGQNEKT